MRRTDGKRYLWKPLFLLFVILMMSVSVRAAVPTKQILIKNQYFTMTINTSQKVTWSTSVKSVARITKIGGANSRSCQIRAVGGGHSIITAKWGKNVKKWDIGVQCPKLSAAKVSLKKGQSAKVVLKGTNQPVTWSVSDKSVATVAKAGSVTGKITAKGPGTAYVYAKVKGVSFKCTVNVTLNKNLTVSPTSLVLKNKKGQVTITYTGSGGIDYMNYNPDVADCRLGSWSGRTIPMYFTGYQKGRHAKIVISGGGESYTLWVRVE